MFDNQPPADKSNFKDFDNHNVDKEVEATYLRQNIARIANAVTITLYSRGTM